MASAACLILYLLYNAQARLMHLHFSHASLMELTVLSNQR